jgi:hypothetical protein
MLNDGLRLGSCVVAQHAPATEYQHRLQVLLHGFDLLVQLLDFLHQLALLLLLSKALLIEQIR